MRGIERSLHGQSQSSGALAEKGVRAWRTGGYNRAMKNTLSALSMLALGLAASAVHAGPAGPVPSIAQAALDDYRGMYQRSPLCAKEEITLWTCESGKRVFSLCSSATASATTGYLQYRAAHAGKLALAYPAEKAAPLGSFTYTSFGNGDVAVEFTNGGYRYSLIDPLRGPSQLRVAAPGPAGKETTIACGGNQSLQLNYTMRLMHDFGLWKGD